MKRLDIIGFKSFAEKISIDFDMGMTAVVGPNGSGKSNITDAIRWVLGEQSARSLRGAKMEDIIFSGSDSRKALNYAEVQLTLDNADGTLPTEFQEVTVTRRVYRSGDSEFEINKQSCRLKDIVDLFMDSGLGREAFSIISQGKVEEILSSKPEDRRTIFEEAAGVLKYKTRKRKAEIKLEETRVNLNRVNDIIYELQHQIEPLKEQSTIAKKYLAKKEELEQYEVAYLAHEIEELNLTWHELTRDVEKQRQLELDSSTTASTYEANLEKIRSQKAEIDEKVNILHQEYTTISEDYERIEGMRAVASERKKNASVNIAKLETEISSNHASLAIIETALKDNQTSLQTIKSEIAETQQQLIQKQGNTFNSEEIESQFNLLRSEQIEHLNQEAAFKHELQILNTQRNQNDLRTARYHDEITKLETEKQALLVSLNETSRQTNANRQGLERCSEELRMKTTLLTETRNKFQKHDAEKQQIAQLLQKKTSRKEALEEMSDGFFQGVKEVLKAKNHLLHGIDGAIAELIQVSKENALAVETALGASLQSIVVKDEQSGRHAIEYLKKNRLGRATFLPLSIIRGKILPQSVFTIVSQHVGYIGSGCDLISFEPKYTEIMQSLLGNVLFAQNLKSANEIAKLTAYRHRIVTLEGDIINPGGAMTGGAGKNSKTTLLTRKSELDEITEQIEELTETFSKHAAISAQTQTEIGQLEKTITTLREHVEVLKVKDTSLNGKLDALKVQEKNIFDRMGLAQSEKEIFDEEIADKHLRLQQITEQLETIQTIIATTNEQLQKLTEQKDLAAKNKENETDEIHELNIHLAQRKEQSIHLQKEITRLSEEKARMDSQTSRLVTELTSLKEDVESNFNGRAELEQESQQKLVEKEKLEAQLAAERSIRVQLHLDEEHQERELKQLRKKLKQLISAIHENELRLERADADMENRITKLSDEYQISFEAAKERYPLTVEPDVAKKRIKEIVSVIEQMGSVNIGAIDEYERVFERFHFLEEQRTDLEEASSTLHTVISEMDEEMIKRFNTSFTEIKREFNQIFPVLFGGGHAELTLTNPDDLLNTGVDIIAQPPGKKLQNLSLLSGGERALTAIAILFAILRVRPVPFCVLDEVEAALDENNVHRFSEYLKHFSSDIQFIVITHRKGTMEEADVLYGVTMQESGVSRLVSVRLEEESKVHAVATS